MPRIWSGWNGLIAAGNALLILAMASLPASVVGPRLVEPFYTIGILIALFWGAFWLLRRRRRKRNQASVPEAVE